METLIKNAVTAMYHAKEQAVTTTSFLIMKSFLHDIAATNGNGIIISAVIAMGKSLGLLMVAEGMENQEQMSFLKAQHCQEGQGFLFSKPVAAEQLAALLVAGLSISTDKS